MGDKIQLKHVVKSSHLRGQLLRNLQPITVLEWFRDYAEGDTQKFHIPIMYGILDTTPGFMPRLPNPFASFELLDNVIQFEWPGGIEPDEPDPEPGDIVMAPVTEGDNQAMHDMVSAWDTIIQTPNMVGGAMDLGRYGNTTFFIANDSMADVCPYTVQFVEGDEDINPSQLIDAIATGGSGNSGTASITYDSTSGPVTISVSITKDPGTVALPNTNPAWGDVGDDSLGIDVLDFPHAIQVRQVAGAWYFYQAPF